MAVGANFSAMGSPVLRRGQPVATTIIKLIINITFNYCYILKRTISNYIVNWMDQMYLLVGELDE
jgi:hypothetical protein